MKQIHLIGCGAVGCEFLKEMSKTCISQGTFVRVHVYDFDIVEERNVCSQSFNYNQIGKNKAETAAEQFANPMLEIIPYNQKVEKCHLDEFPMDEDTIVVDAVDNLPTRKVLWFHGYAKKCPVLHLGLSVDGWGIVGWNYGTKNGYVFDFISMPRNQYERLCNTDVHLPPCELNQFRSVISWVGVYGAVSAANYYGISSAGPLQAFLKENQLGKVCEKLCASFRISDNEVEFRKAPHSFYSVQLEEVDEVE